MEIKNVISDEELENRLVALRKDNWKIDNMAKGLSGNAKQIVDNWFDATRLMLLRMLKFKENDKYNFVYHDLENETI